MSTAELELFAQGDELEPALLLSDDELATLDDSVDVWADDDHDAFVVPFDDGLGFDWPDVDVDAEVPF